MAKAGKPSETLELIDPADDVVEGALAQARAVTITKAANGDAPAPKKGRTGSVATAVDGAYGAEQIQVLKGLDAVRKRPAMYIGSTSEKGLHHLVYEVVDNAVDEAMAGHCDTIEVTINVDGSCSVLDNGRGIPVEPHPTEKISTLEVVLTVLHAGGKFSGEGYKVSGGLHGVGVSVVNALASKLVAEVSRDGKLYRMEFDHGHATTKLDTVGSSKKNGTRITFWPDAEIFESVVFDFSTLSRRFKELAFLNRGLTITFTDLRETDKFRSYCYPGGLKAFIEELNHDHEVLHKQIFYTSQVVKASDLDDERREIQIEAALQYNDGYKDRMMAFANNINTVEGGTHMEGIKSALTRSLNAVAKKTKVLKEKDKNLSGDDAREGLTCVLSVKLPDPQFEGQTKTQLGNSYMKGLVDSVVYEEFSNWLEQNPSVLKKIIMKGLQAQRAREAAKAARDRTRKQSLLRTGVLSGKLADCSEINPDENELFLVEGDSAGGSAKQARDRRFQAILPLRGKIINVEKARIDKVLSNEEIGNLITAIGTNIGEEFDDTKRRYDKIIIMTDADVDGAHIRTLILTFFFRHMPELITKGHVYVAQPPLFKVTKGKESVYCLDQEAMEAQVKAYGGKTTVQRFKGLGEMDAAELEDTTMDPANRTLLRVEIIDQAEADETFDILMGDTVEPRRDFINERAKTVIELDI
ncbi:MAG: DNA topoisomerase (ATP-hydrolyzing) subunit B [bacterium]